MELMQCDLQTQLPHIRELCRKHQVARLDVFGSAVSQKFGPESDFDFLVFFHRDEETNAFHQYFDLKEGLEELLQRPVDLVCGNSIRNTVFKKQVEASKVSLYAA